MRILLITPDYPPPPGGIQTLTKNLERGLENAGHTVEILESEPAMYSPEFLLSLPSLSPAALTTPKQLLKYLYFNHCYRRTQKRISSYKPDIVHVLHRGNWPALLAAKQNDLPSVLSTYALELENRQETAQAASLADNIHAISNFTANLVSDVTDVSKDEITVIPPSIDVDSYSDKSMNNWSKSPVVTIARLVPRKNIESLTEAWSRVDKKIKNERDLYVIGDGPEREKQEAKYQAEDDVTFTGWISEEEKRSLLQKAGLFTLIPQRFGFDVEGFGIVYIEAQAAGTPVVGSRTGGVPEAVGDGGITVEDPTNTEEITTAIETALDDTWQEETRKAITSRVHQFNLDIVAGRHIKNYEMLVESNK